MKRILPVTPDTEYVIDQSNHSIEVYSVRPLDFTSLTDEAALCQATVSPCGCIFKASIRKQYSVAKVVDALKFWVESELGYTPLPPDTLRQGDDPGYNHDVSAFMQLVGKPITLTNLNEFINRGMMKITRQPGAVRVEVLDPGWLAIYEGRT